MENEEKTFQSFKQQDFIGENSAHELNSVGEMEQKTVYIFHVETIEMCSSRIVCETRTWIIIISEFTNINYLQIFAGDIFTYAGNSSLFHFDMLVL